MPRKKRTAPEPSEAIREAQPAAERNADRLPSEFDATQAAERPGGSPSFPVVGIGASAGGLEAFRQLLEGLPVDTGMAFVLVQHLDPTHKSILTELLARGTKLPVREVRDGARVEPDHVYVIPPNASMAIADGVLRLLPREEGRAGRHPVDAFLRALAEDQSHRAIGVILSGTDSDGTLGLEAIKAEGGITFAQEPQSAKYDGMPRSAITAGHVDFVLTPGGIAQELARISRHPYAAAVAATPTEGARPAKGKNGFRRILTWLHRAKGVDFTDYKTSTLHRRITRRMVLNKFESLDDYAEHLRANVVEVEALYQDILINVTSFFRNPESFALLKSKIFPQVVRQRTPDEPIRIWTLGCSTGEEAYSIAMSFVEFAGDHAEHVPVQIFGTDLSDKGIEKARLGLYPKDIAEDVSDERLRRFFVEADGGYRVSKPIRDMVVFARQNVIADPPFSKLDLISCRNLLIYLEPVLQKRVLPLLHYALKPTGMLWLGTSETVGAAAELFEPEDKKHRFYTKKATAARLHFPAARGDVARERTEPGQTRTEGSELARAEPDAHKEADRILLARYAPASVLINEEMEILQVRGSTGAYLEAPAGKATLNVLKMARKGLMLPLRAAIQKAQKDLATIRKEGIRVGDNGEYRQVNLEVVPIKDFAARERSLLVLFEPAPQQAGSRSRKHHDDAAGGRASRKTDTRQVALLQEELAATREYLQSLIEQQEAANEELQSSSEEIQSSNEELQSINEELETAKEELESSNEELATLNDEMHNRNLELTTLNDDQSNLLATIHIPILMLGRDFRIRRFTPQAEKVLGLIPTDVGRPIGDIRLKVDVPDLKTLVAEVMETVRVDEREVEDSGGRSYSMRLRPYRTSANKIDGAVLVLVDITERKQAELATVSLAAIVESSDDAIISKDLNGVIRSWNSGAERVFGYTALEAIGQPITMLIPPDRQPKEAGILARVARGERVDHFETVRVRKGGGPLEVELTISPLKDGAGRIIGASKVARDISERKRAEETLRESEERYRTLFTSIDEGFCVIEKVDGQDGDPLDFRYVETNPAFAAQSGVGGVLGKTIRQVVPGEPEEWFETYDAVLRTGDAIRFERGLVTQGRVLDLYAFRIGDGARRRVAVIFKDITARKQAEEALRRDEGERRSRAEELARFNQAAVGREVRMIELKKEVNELCRQHGEGARYPLEFEPGRGNTDG